MAQQPSSSTHKPAPHELRPDEIKLLSDVNVTVGRQIASGRYGGALKSVIYEGTFTTDTGEHESGEKVAIKWLRFTKHEAQSVENELATLNEIKHPNIVDIRKAVWLSQYEVAIVMELATYGSLDTWIKMLKKGECQPLTLDQFKKFAHGLAEALRTLHQTGRAHCDMHQGNVLIFEDTKDGGVIPKLADFGSVITSKTEKEQNVRNVQEWDRDYIGDLLDGVGSVAVKAEKRENVQRVVEEAKKICLEENK